MNLMNLRDSQLRGLPVVTASGLRLGRVAGLLFDPMFHTIAKYLVYRSGWLSWLVADELLVDPKQVVALDAERMVVSDTFTPVKTRAEKPGLHQAPTSVGLSGSVRE